MSDHREPFEQELQRMLAIDASVDLQSRIRARAFAAPSRRFTWFAWSSGLTAAMAAIILAVLYIQPKKAEVLPATPQVVVEQTVPSEVVAPTEKPTRPQAARRVEKKTVAANVVWTRVEIEVAPVKEFKLNDSIKLADSIIPIPQPQVLSIALLDPITIEPPPTMTVGKLE
jgi:hypothetical protein